MTLLSPNTDTVLARISAELQEKVHTRLEITELAVSAVNALFLDCDFSIYLHDPSTGAVVETHRSEDGWQLSAHDQDWIMAEAQKRLMRSEPDASQVLVDRRKDLRCDKTALKADLEKYGEHAYLFLVQCLVSEDELILGIVIIRSWRVTPLVEMPEFKYRQKRFLDLSKVIALALDDLYIHQKIETLLIPPMRWGILWTTIRLLDWLRIVSQKF